MSSLTSRESTLINQVIKSGSVDVAIPYDPGGSLATEVVIEDINQNTVAYDLFFSIDDDGYLFSVPILVTESSLDGTAPIFGSRIKVQIFPPIVPTYVAPGEDLLINSLVINVTNFSLTTEYTVHFKYIIYGEKV